MKNRNFDSINVKEIARLITDGGNTETIIAGKLKRKEWWQIDVTAASVAITLRELKTLADGLYLAKQMPELMGDTAGATQSILKVLSTAFAELESDNKHQLLPLFFSFDMQTEKSFFIEDRNLRGQAFNAFEKLNSNGLPLAELKKAYLAFNPWHKEMTKHGDIFHLYEQVLSNEAYPKPINDEPAVSDKVSPVVIEDTSVTTKRQDSWCLTTLKSPNQAYFNRNLTLNYESKVGVQLREGDPIFSVSDQQGSVVTRARRNTILREILVPAGTKIKSSGLDICVVWETDKPFHEALKQEAEMFDAARTLSNSCEEGSEDGLGKDPSSIEKRLERLKLLYTKNLISKSVYEEKQRDIISEI